MESFCNSLYLNLKFTLFGFSPRRHLLLLCFPSSPTFPSLLKHARKEWCAQNTILFLRAYQVFSCVIQTALEIQLLHNSVLNWVKFNEYYWPLAIFQTACWYTEDTKKYNVCHHLFRLRKRKEITWKLCWLTLPCYSVLYRRLPTTVQVF